MAGHVDSRILVRVPLAVTWEVANSYEDDTRHDSEGHAIVATDAHRRAVTLRVATPPDAEGRSWTYYVERVQDPERHTVYARRFGNPFFVYSHALWVYRQVAGGSEIRCV